jgi:hypothetical protein
MDGRSNTIDRSVAMQDIVFGEIQRLAAKDTFGVSEDVVIPAELRKRGSVAEYLLTPVILGKTLKALGYRQFGTALARGNQQRIYVRVPDGMALEDLPEYAKGVLEEAKALWHIARKKPEPRLPLEVRQIQDAAKRITSVGLSKTAVAVVFKTPNDAYAFKALLDRYREK